MIDEEDEDTIPDIQEDDLAKSIQSLRKSQENQI